MKVTRIYTGDDNRSHFEDIEVDFPERAGLSARTPAFEAQSISFREADEIVELDFHNAPRRQFVVTIAGRAEIECGDGSKLAFGCGDVFFAEDTTGEGHITRSLEVPRRSVVVPVPDDFDLGRVRG